MKYFAILFFWIAFNNWKNHLTKTLLPVNCLIFSNFAKCRVDLQVRALSRLRYLPWGAMRIKK